VFVDIGFTLTIKSSNSFETRHWSIKPHQLRCTYFLLNAPNCFCLLYSSWLKLYPQTKLTPETLLFCFYWRTIWHLRKKHDIVYFRKVYYIRQNRLRKFLYEVEISKWSSFPSQLAEFVKLFWLISGGNNRMTNSSVESTFQNFFDVGNEFKR